MNRFLLSVVAICMAAACWAKTADFSAQNSSGKTLYYSITNASKKTVEVVYDASYKSLTDSLLIPATVEYQQTEYVVAGIDTAAFAGCTGITSFYPSTRTKYIEAQAFKGCTNLSIVSLCNDSLTTIGYEAFRGASKIRYIALFHTNIDLPKICGANGKKTDVSEAFDADVLRYARVNIYK